MDTKIKIETHVTDIILFDINGYSCLSDEDQYLTIYLINRKLKEFLDILHGQSFLKTEEAILGFAPTGDGAYIILNHNIAGYGLFLGISLRTSLLQLQNQTNNLFSGLKTAIHFGTACPIQDITGNQNFVGNGLNNCFRLLDLAKSEESKAKEFVGDDNLIIASKEAKEQFYNLYPKDKIQGFLDRIEFRFSDDISKQDKHYEENKKTHIGSFLECSRLVQIVPPKPPDINERLRIFAEKINFNQKKEI